MALEGSSVEVVSTRTLTKLAIGVGMGSFIEYFDFFIAAVTAAVVWPHVFFSWASAPLAYSLSLISFGVLYFTRPIGAYLFGYYGDRVGRRALMVVTLSVMAVGMAGVGLTPSFATIGIASVVLLFAFRIVFGLGIGGEFGGGASWLVEYAKKSKWRAFWTVWIQPSIMGSAVASFVFTAVAAGYGNALFTIGWRIPFLVGTFMIIVAFVIRYKLTESPLFRTLKEKHEIEHNPASRVIKERWKSILLLAGIFMFIPSVGNMQAVYSTAYLAARGLSPSFAVFSAGVGAAVGSIFLIMAGFLGEFMGRKKTFLFSELIQIIALLVYVPLLNTLNPSLVILAQIFLEAAVAIGVTMSSVVFAEYFPTRYRASGAGLSFQFGGLIAGIEATFILPLIIVLGGGAISSAPDVMLLMIVVTILSLVFTLGLKETKGERMAG